VTTPEESAAPDDRLVLRSGLTRLTIDARAGGRFSSLVVDGHELLVTEGAGPMLWGCYPMAPFAGRIGAGRFTFRGRPIQIPRNLPPHAIHGTTFVRPWRILEREADRAVLATDLGPEWPFRGQVTQAVGLRADGLEATLVLEADEPMPASLGWHPWFRRRLIGTSERPLPSSSALDLTFTAERMFVRGPHGLPTGATTPPGPHPWDDAFTDLVAPPRVTWPGTLTLELASAAAVWVVYEPEEAVCIEPQTAPPDVVNLAVAAGQEPPTAEPGCPASIVMSWRWSSESSIGMLV